MAPEENFAALGLTLPPAPTAEIEALFELAD